MSVKPTERSPALSGGLMGPSMFKSLQDEMDRMFHAFAVPQMSWETSMPTGAGSLGLRVDIGETDKEIHVEADLPGVPEDAVAVTLEDNMLRIRAERKTDDETTEKNMRIVERSHGVFERAIRMPAGIDPQKVTASFDKGVLSVRLPKPQKLEAASHRIAIGNSG